MKKILSVALSTAMAFSMFASVAFGADTVKLTPEQQFNVLKDAGIVTGYPDGTAGLDKSITRAELAKVIVKSINLEPITGVATYKDKNYTASHWAAPFIEAATQAGILQGKNLEKKLFDPTGNVTVQELAKVLVAALKLEVPAETNNTATEWAKGYVEAAVKAGYLEAGINYQANATRAQAVVAAHAIYEVNNFKVVKAEASDATHVKLTLSTGEVVDVVLEKALEANKATELTYKAADGRELKYTVTYVVTAAQKISSVTANNYRELTLKFDGDLDAKTAGNEDNYKVSGVTFKSATLSADKREVKLLVEETSASLPKQKETSVEVKGVKNSDASKTFDEKVKFTAIDTQLPEVSEAKALGTKAIKIVFSEPVKAATASNLGNYKIDGKAISGYVKFTYPNIVFITTDVTVGEHKLTVSGVEDFNDFKVSPIALDLTVAEDTAAPEVVSAKATDLKKVEIEFNEPVKSVKKAYQTSSNKVASVEINDNKVTLTFIDDNRLSLGESTVYLEGVTDYSNNAADRNTTVKPELDVTRPEVTSVSAEAKDAPTARTLITVEFSKSVHKDDIAKSENFILRNDKGEVYSGKGFTTKGYPVKTPVYAKDKNNKNVENKVVLESIDKLPAGKYSLEVLGIRDQASIGNTLVPVKVDFTVTETGAVQANSSWYVTDGDDTLVYIQYNKAVEASGDGDATQINKYSYVANGTNYPFPAKSARAELYSSNTVRITVPTADLTNWAGVTSIRATNVADVNGNYLTSQLVAINNINSSYVQIKASDVKATDRKTIKIKTESELSYVNKNDFRFTGITPVNANFNVTNTEDNNTIIEITFDEEVIPFNSNVTVSTVAQNLIQSKDSYGRPLKAFSVTVADEIKPELSAEAAEAPTAQNDKITLTFTENIQQYFTPKAYKVAVNGNSVDAVSATVVGGNKLEITVANAIPTGATVEVYLENNATGKFVTDTAGNAADDFFSKSIIAGATSSVPAITPVIAQGSTEGTTTATVTAASGNTLKYALSATKPSVPNVGATASGTNYTSGDEINASVGQWLAVSEVNAAGKVVGFYTVQLTASEVQPVVVQSTAPLAADITASTAAGTIVVTGLAADDIVKVYSNSTLTTAVGSSATAVAGTATVTTAITAGTDLYVTVTSTNKSESAATHVVVQP